MNKTRTIKSTSLDIFHANDIIHPQWLESFELLFVDQRMDRISFASATLHFLELKFSSEKSVNNVSVSQHKLIQFPVHGVSLSLFAFISFDQH